MKFEKRNTFPITRDCSHFQGASAGLPNRRCRQPISQISLVLQHAPPHLHGFDWLASKVGNEISKHAH